MALHRVDSLIFIIDISAWYFDLVLHTWTCIAVQFTDSFYVMLFYCIDCRNDRESSNLGFI